MKNLEIASYIIKRYFYHVYRCGFKTIIYNSRKEKIADYILVIATPNTLCQLIISNLMDRIGL